MISTMDWSFNKSLVPTGASRSSGPPEGVRKRLLLPSVIVFPPPPVALSQLMLDGKEVVPGARFHDPHPPPQPRALVLLSVRRVQGHEARVALVRRRLTQALEERVVEGLRHG